MNEKALRSLDRIIDRMDRQARRPRRVFSTAPIVLALGLILADVLLCWIVPAVWESVLPHGLAQAWGFRGWPGLVWRSAVFCHANQSAVRIGIGVASVAALLAGRGGRALRLLVWLSAVGVILLNAGILVVTIRTGLRLTAATVGLDLD